MKWRLPCRDVMAETSKQEGAASSRSTAVTYNRASVATRGTMFTDVTNQLMDEVKTAYKETGKLSDDILAALNCVFQSTLLPALDLVDNKSVTIVTCPAGRTLYQVLGSSGSPYSCFTTSCYCSCPAYRFSVLKKEEHIMCKHVLAAKLSEAMGVCKSLEVSDQELANMITQID